MIPADAQPSPDLGRLASEYDFIREVGRGGMATVFLARNRTSGQLVAVKAIHARYLDDPEAMARFAREAQLVADLVHPNIVRTHAVERVGERTLAIVMEYVAGGTLRDALRQGGPLPYPRVTEVLRDVAQGLRYAHGRGVVHRDVKPENVFIDEHTARACLSDFGVARSLESDSERLTLTGASLGTPAYMSPEQIDGLPVDGRSDLYSLGLVGWELLAGRRPWEGDTLYSVIYKQKHEPLPRLNELRPDIPRPLLYAIEGALQKHRDERWANAEEFIGQLADRVPPVSRTRNMPTMRFRRDDVAAAGGVPAGERGAGRESPVPLSPAAAGAAIAPAPGALTVRRDAAPVELVPGGEVRPARRRMPRWSIPVTLAAAAIAVAVGLEQRERGDRSGTRADSLSIFTRGGDLSTTADSLADSGTAGPPAARTPAPATPAPAASTPAASAPRPADRPAAATRPRSHADSLARCRSPLFVDQRACLFASLADEDAELNRTYGALVADLRRRDGAAEPESVRRLRAAQRSWLVQRDEACQRQNPGDSNGIWAPVRARCLGEHAERRARELEAERRRIAGS